MPDQAANSEQVSVDPVRNGAINGENAGRSASDGDSPPSFVGPPAANRDRLPDERPAITHHFAIGGHEGYLTAGLYPNGAGDAPACRSCGALMSPNGNCYVCRNCGGTSGCS